MKPQRLLRSTFGFVIGLASITLVGCATNAERDALCAQSHRWNSVSTQVSMTLDEISKFQPEQLREIFEEVVQTLILINESASRDLRADTEVLLNTFGALSDALAEIDWEGDLAQKDSAVTSAGVRLASSEVQQAQANLATYIVENCDLEIDSPVNKFPNVGTTLPDPIIQDETIELPPVGYDNDESVVRAFGFVVVERFGVAITNEQAACVGVGLIAANANDSKVVDETYWQMLQLIFDSCDVKIDVAKALEDE